MFGHSFQKIMMAPDPAGSSGGGTGQAPPDDEETGTGEETEAGEGDEDDEDEEEEEKPKPKEKPKEKGKPKGKPKGTAKVSLSPAELRELRDKATKFDESQETQRKAAEVESRRKENEQAKTNPVKALESVRRRYENEIRSRDDRIKELETENSGLTGRLRSGVLDTGLREAIAKAAEAAKVTLKKGSVDYIIKDLSGQFDVEDDGENFSIFDKVDGKDATEVVTGLMKSKYKEVFGVEAETNPSGMNGANRRPMTNGKPERPSYSAAYKKALESQDTTGIYPGIGLRPKSQT